VIHLYWILEVNIKKYYFIDILLGYTGVDTAEFLRRYQAKIFVYEPVPSFVQILQEKFGSNPRVKIFPFAVDAEDGVIKLSDDGMASSAFEDGKIEAKVKNVVDVLFEAMLEENKLQIDLLHINCEGCELGIIERLIEYEDGYLLTKIKNIEVQFHFQQAYQAMESRPRYCRIQEILSKTHTQTYHFHYIWESWRLQKQL
jgi:FkbM family methyltransferase